MSNPLYVVVIETIKRSLWIEALQKYDAKKLYRFYLVKTRDAFPSIQLFPSQLSIESLIFNEIL